MTDQELTKLIKLTQEYEAMRVLATLHTVEYVFDHETEDRFFKRMDRVADDIEELLGERLP